MWGRGASPQTPGLTPGPGARPHRHGPAAVQTLDGRLSFPLTPELHKGTAWGRIEVAQVTEAKGSCGPE